MSEPKDFNGLVAWATWTLIEAITKGEPLSRAVHQVLAYARQWQPQETKATGEQP